MKKLLLIVSSFVLALTLSVSSVMAAPSPTTTVESTPVFLSDAVVVTENGVVVNLADVNVIEAILEANPEALAEFYSDLPAAMQEQIALITDEDEAAQLIADLIADATIEVPEAFKANLTKLVVEELMDISLDSAGNAVVLEDGSVQVTFDRPNVSAGDPYLVLHFNEDTGAWELVPTEVLDGQIVATFDSLSPVAIVTATEVTQDADAGSSTNIIPFVVGGVAVIGIVLIVLAKTKKA